MLSIFVIFDFQACLLQQALYAFVCLPTLPVSHHEYPYAKALVANPAHLRGCGFESRQGHGCLSLVNVVCCRVEVHATGRSRVQMSPVTRVYVVCVCMCECGLETSTMRWPGPKKMKALDTCCPPFVSYTISFRYKPRC
jgi:hypothetical protein